MFLLDILFLFVPICEIIFKEDLDRIKEEEKFHQQNCILHGGNKDS